MADFDSTLNNGIIKDQIDKIFPNKKLNRNLIPNDRSPSDDKFMNWEFLNLCDKKYVLISMHVYTNADTRTENESKVYHTYTLKINLRKRFNDITKWKISGKLTWKPIPFDDKTYSRKAKDHIDKFEEFEMKLAFMVTGIIAEFNEKGNNLFDPDHKYADIFTNRPFG
jgi:hypothetical protein